MPKIALRLHANEGSISDAADLIPNPAIHENGSSDTIDKYGISNWQLSLRAVEKIRSFAATQNVLPRAMHLSAIT